MLWLFPFILFANTQSIQLNTNGLSLMKFIEIVSKQLQENIVITEKIEGEIDFMGHTQINQHDLLQLLKSVLNQKGYKLEKVHKLYYVKKIKKSKHKANRTDLNVHQIKIRFAHVKEVFSMVQVFVEQEEKKSKEAKTLVLKDEINNALLIYANREKFEVIKALVSYLDKENKQVYVHTKILEISENRLKNLGLKYGLDKLHTSSLGDVFTLGANLGSSVNALSSDFASLFEMSQKSVSSAVALGATLNLLKTNQVIDIVSQPSLLCVNNKTSSIYVGETKSFQTGLSVTDGGNQNSTFVRENIGLTLKVTPRITNKNQVTLDILTIVEDAKALQTNQVNPDTTKKEVQTRAVVNNAQSVILGGLIKTKHDTTNSKIPFFGDIPVLGALFKHKKAIVDKVNLVVIVTPYIVNQSLELTQIKHALAELKKLEQEQAKQMHARLLDLKEHTNSKSNSKIQQQELLKPTNPHMLHKQLLKNL
jgi:general secretion pathway protein D